MKKTLSFSILLLSLLQGGAAAADYGLFRGEASYVYRELFVLQEGHPYLFETRNLSEGGDTVMYLWSSSEKLQVAYNDDYEGLASRIEYTPQQTGEYLLIVKSYGNESQGFCEVWKNGQLHGSTPFAGWHVAGGSAAGDIYQGIMIPEGAPDAVLYVFDAETMELSVLDDDSGVGLAPRVAMEHLGDRLAVLSLFDPPFPEMNAGLVFAVIDAVADQDGDDLGPAFEQSACTCDSKTGSFVCPAANNPEGQSFTQDCTKVDGTSRDTDNDGLWDDWEILGIDDPTSPQYLLGWGALPFRKDLFVEVDWENDVLVGKMATSVSIGVAATYNESGTASALNNPDGSDGVKVHLDTGQTSPCYNLGSPACTMYGDWGGATYNIMPYWTCSQDRSFHFPTEPSGNPCVTIPGDYVIKGGLWSPSYAAFAQARRKVFHYAIIVASGGGVGHEPGIDFWANKASYVTFSHELGHNVDVGHGGSKASGHANCKPMYRSLMNYAYSNHPAFSKNQYTGITLDPTALDEAYGMGPGTAWNLAAVAPFYFAVESPSDPDDNDMVGIDWNRDGIIAPVDTLVRGVPNSSHPPSLASCEWARYRHDRVIAGSSSIPKEQTPEVVHAKTGAINQTWMLYTDGSGVYGRFSSSDFNVANPPGCLSSLDKGCGVWSSSPYAVSGSCSQVDPLTGPAAAVFSTPEDPGPYIVAAWNVPASGSCGANTSSKLYYWVYKVSTGTVQIQGWVSGSDGVTGEPSMARYDGGVLLAFRCNGKFCHSDMSTYSTVFQVPTIARDQYNSYYNTNVSPGLGSFPDAGNKRQVLAVLTDSSDKMYWVKWAWINGGPGVVYNQWDDITTGTGIDSHSTKKKVGLAWVPFKQGQLPGRFYLAWADEAHKTASGVPIGKIDFTRGDGTGSLPIIFENKNYADNVWFELHGGVNLFLDPAIDNNLRMATVFVYKGNQDLQFRPFADGIFPVQMKDNHDFVNMRTGLCVSFNDCSSTSTCGSNPLSPGYPCADGAYSGGVPVPSPPHEDPP